MFERKVPEALREVRQALERFSAKGFRVAREDYDSQSFGNVTVDLVARDLRLRMTRDRGQYFINVGAIKDEEWFDEHSVLVLLGARDEADELLKQEWVSLDLVAESIARYLPQIREAFTAAQYPTTRDALHRMESKRAQELFGFNAPPNSR